MDAKTESSAVYISSTEKVVVQLRNEWLLFLTICVEYPAHLSFKVMCYISVQCLVCAVFFLRWVLWKSSSDICFL